MLRAAISNEVNMHVACMLQITADVTNSSNRGKVEIYSHSISDCTLFTVPSRIPRINIAILTAVLGHTQISLRAASLLVHMLNGYSVK